MKSMRILFALCMAAAMTTVFVGCGKSEETTAPVAPAPAEDVSKGAGMTEQPATPEEPAAPETPAAPEKPTPPDKPKDHPAH